MKSLIYIMAAMALSLSPSVFESANVDPEQSSIAFTPPEPVTHAQEEVPGQEHMLEYAGLAQQTNGCFDAMMGMGCRIQSQIPVWNRFAAMFASQLGITCPIGTDVLQL